MREKYDFLIIGGGIIGLSIGNEILNKMPNSSVLIAEKESSIGTHASGRNSGVLHAGFYYSPESLKAKFCLEGNYQLRTIIKESQIPLNECGKIVVAQNESDLKRLVSLYDRGIVNGSKLELLDEKDLNKFEPLAKTYKKFIWSPLTAVSDPELVNLQIRKSFLAKGGSIETNATVTLENENSVRINKLKIKAERIVNAAGSNALNIAHSVDMGMKYAQLPVLGQYRITKKDSLPLRTLVYPVPNPVNPFLGVHFTLTVTGDVKIGPTAIPIIGREQYSIKNIPDSADFRESFSAIVSMLKHHPIQLTTLAKNELPKISTSILINQGRKLIPKISSDVKWNVKKPGIRAQLVNLDKGQFEMDFVIEQRGNVTQILNLVSPGWTSAIPFSKWIVSKYL